MIERPLRQGDVLLMRVADIPVEARPAAGDPRLPGRHVLAWGEVTGHHHSVSAVDAEMLTTAEAVYLRIMRETTLDHQEHGAITLAPGLYRRIGQREYTPGAIVSVAD